MPANDGMTDRRQNAEFYQGAALDGTFRQLAPDRGGFVEFGWPQLRSDQMGWPYAFDGVWDDGDLMPDEALRAVTNRPMK